MLRHFSFWLWHCQMNTSGACKRLGRSTMRYMLCTNQEIYHAIEHHVQQDERRGESLRRLPIFYFFHLTIFILLLLFFFPCPIQLDRQRQKVCAFMVLGCHRCKCCRSDVKIWMAQPFLSNHSSGQHSNNYGTLSSNSTYPFACDYKPFLNSPNQEVYIYIYINILGCCLKTNFPLVFIVKLITSYINASFIMTAEQNWYSLIIYSLKCKWAIYNKRYLYSLFQLLLL